MLLVNTENIPGRNYEVIGLVTGICIMSKNIGRDIGSGFRNLVGGEMKSYVDMLTDSKNMALDRIAKEAESLGADAVVNIRFTTSSIIQGGAEILASGTAVRFI